MPGFEDPPPAHSPLGIRRIRPPSKQALSAAARPKPRGTRPDSLVVSVSPSPGGTGRSPRPLLPVAGGLYPLHLARVTVAVTQEHQQYSQQSKRTTDNPPVANSSSPAEGGKIGCNGNFRPIRPVTPADCLKEKLSIETFLYGLRTVLDRQLKIARST